MTETLPTRRRSGRIARRAAMVAAPVALVAAATAGVTLAAAPSGAATRSQQGQLGSVWQSTITHQVHVHGWAYDSRPGHRDLPVTVSIYVNGTWKRSVKTDGTSPTYDNHRHIHGRHAFSAVVNGPRKATGVRLVVHNAHHSKRAALTDTTTSIAHKAPTSEKIVHVAKDYVGSRYSYGADGPNAFDCSGYSKFVYRKADVANLPHNSQAQRGAKHMHAISRSHARPGDLVFYLSGGEAYHVSIYAGHGMQYSATNPRRGVEHSKIFSHNVVFRTDWH